MRTDTPHRSSIGRWLAAGLAALALGAAPLAAQDPSDGYGYDPGAAAASPAAGDDASSVNDYPASTAQSPDGSYGYFHVVQGQATDSAASGERAAAEVNQPVLAGDRITVPRGSRLEIVLPDHNLLRLDGGTEVVLERLAGSADSNDRETKLHLVQGNLQLVVVSDALGEQLPRLDTGNASVYVNYPGTYRVTANARDWTSLVVRRGTADMATERGTVTVRADQEAVAEGTRDAEADVRAAGAFDPLERWGRQLSDQVAEVPNVDQDLQYSASSLAQYGSWIDVDGAQYWRPQVDTGWRPYWHGRWIYTPSGLTWVPYEPWGWVPYHYGTWDYLPAYGWVWAPGYVYSPAWVYWYWGPSYTGWCPVGYYTRFYRHRFLDPGFRFGVYGWAGGDWGAFARWNFVGAGHFGHRDLDRWVVPGRALRDRAHLAQLPHGIITTDTRGITPVRWGHPREVISVLQGGPAGRGGRLPDVTPFIARDPRLPTNVLHAVATDGPAKGRLTGTPLRPTTLRGQPEPGLRSPRAAAGLPAGPRTGGRAPGQIAPRTDRPGLGRDARAGRPAITVPPRDLRLDLAPPSGRLPGDWRERADRQRPVAPERPRIVVPQGGDERGRPPAAPSPRQPDPRPDVRREAVPPRSWQRPQRPQRPQDTAPPRGAYPSPQPRYGAPADRGFARPPAPREIYRPAPRFERPAAPPPAVRQAPSQPPPRRAPAPPPPRNDRPQRH
jgi:hypothetical protein